MHENNFMRKVGVQKTDAGLASRQVIVRFTQDQGQKCPTLE